MSDIAAEFAGIQKMHSCSTLHTEGNVPVVVLPEFKFRAGTEPVQMTLLLHPSLHSGYVTRLFFERKLEGAGLSKNWNHHTVLGRNWWAPSWQDVSPEQPWVSMLGAHLRAVA
jgi:hypothetical protein